VANTVKLYRNGASPLAKAFGVGFIDWLDRGFVIKRSAAVRAKLKIRCDAEWRAAALIKQPSKRPLAMDTSPAEKHVKDRSTEERKSRKADDDESSMTFAGRHSTRKHREADDSDQESTSAIPVHTLSCCHASVLLRSNEN